MNRSGHTSAAAGLGSSLQASEVVKIYGRSTVLSDVTITLEPGSVHGLVGHNGAGKSTLVGILTGRIQPEAGHLELSGEKVAFPSPGAAADLGVVAVPQEILLPDDMTVAEVVTLGHEPTRFGFVRSRQQREMVSHVFAELGMSIDIDARVSSLPVSWQKVVLVAQVIHRNADVIILDEPTAGMNSEDAERVVNLVLALRERGHAVLYISHRFDEVERLCDEVTILRDGSVAAHLEGEKIHQRMLIDVMMGADEREVTAVAEERFAVIPRQQSSGASLSYRGPQQDGSGEIRVDVEPGAIVGLAGLPGSGAQTVFSASYGMAGRAHQVMVGETRVRSPRTAMEAGVAFLPASRLDALLGDELVLENLVLASLPSAARAGFLTRRRGQTFAGEVTDFLRLQPMVRQQMHELSGGSQQRVLVGSRLLRSPRFLVLEDPTVGVDVAARAELHTLVRSLAEGGVGCLIGSTEPAELAELCERVIVMRKGRIACVLAGPELTEKAVVQAMTADAA